MIEPAVSRVPWDPFCAAEGDWIEAVWSLIYPGVCQICHGARATRREGYVCGECRRRAGHLRWVRPPWCARCGLPYAGEATSDFVCGNCHDLDLDFDGARASVVATDFLLEVIHRYKYGRARWFEPFLAGLLAAAAVPELMATGPWDGLVPVPLHPLREREREFNQARRLALWLSRATAIPVRGDLVVRRGPTRTQALLARRERIKNVAGAFTVRAGRRTPGARWVVIDDVLTTGATTSAVSQALRAAGAREVRVWTLARGV